MKEKLRIVKVEPNNPAYVTEIENTLEAEQEAVGGLIELIYNGDGTIIVCNDEGKLIGMEGNRILENGSVIAGPFFVVGDTGEEYRVYMPQNSYMKNGEKKYEDYVHPITREARFDLDNAVVYAYEQRMHMREEQEYSEAGEEEEPGLVIEQAL